MKCCDNILVRDRRERSRQAFPMGKLCLKIDRNDRTGRIPDYSPGTDQFLEFPWFFNTYLPIGKVPVDLWYTVFEHVLLREQTIPPYLQTQWFNELINIVNLQWCWSTVYWYRWRRRCLDIKKHFHRNLSRINREVVSLKRKSYHVINSN